MNTYSVNSDGGLDTNTGTAEKPFRTLQRAHKAMAAGDKCLAFTGKYASGLVVDKPDLTFVGSGPIEVRSAAKDVIVVNAPNTKFLDIGVHDAKRAGFFFREAHGSEVVGGGAFDCAVQGLFSAYTSKLVIRGVHVARIGAQHGAYLSNGGDESIVEDCLFEDCGRSAIQVNGDGADFLKTELGTHGDGIMRGTVIRRNIIRRTGLTGQGAAINLMMAPETRVEWNTIEDARAGGVNFGLDDKIEGNEKYFTINCRMLHNGMSGKRGVSIKKGATVFLDWNDIVALDGPAVDWDTHSLPTFGKNNILKAGGGHKQVSVAGDEMSFSEYCAIHPAVDDPEGESSSTTVEVMDINTVLGFTQRIGKSLKELEDYLAGVGNRL